MDTKNSKILLVVSAVHHYRNYIKTEALKEIKDRVVFLARPELAKMDFGVTSDRVFYYSYSAEKELRHRHVFNINSYQNRWRSAPFAFRLSRLKPRQLRIYRILSLPLLGSIVKFIFLKRSEDKTLFELIQKINPSIILIPSHAFDGMTFELIRIAKKIKIPSFILTDQWDTLPNKTIFTIKPDYLGVWSRQGVEHAVEIRRMPKERVFILGVPRFMEYMKKDSKYQPSPYPFRYILYAGSPILYDELSALKKIDEMVDKYKMDLKVVYRPPLGLRDPRKCPDVFFEYNFKHTILDIPARLYYKRELDSRIKDGFNPVYSPDINYIHRLLLNMEFMICPVSTLVLEASLLDKKAFALVYDDGLDYFSLKHLFNCALHSKGIERLKNVRMVYNVDDLEKIFSPGDELKQSVEPIDIDYFVSKEATINYPENLKKTIDTILASYYEKKST